MTPADPATDGLQNNVVPDFVIDTLARAILPSLRSFYNSEEGRTAFEEWCKRNQENT